MEKNKFLTVFAVYDDDSQRKLCNLQKEILKIVKSKGSQTMDIPFHITLGSYPISEEFILCDKINNICLLNDSFEIDLRKIGFFDNRVVFVEPMVNSSLLKLHKEFDSNYANGFDWHAHTTLYIDNNSAEVELAKRVAIEKFESFTAKVVGIQLGEFFPTRMIGTYNLKERKKEQK